MSAAKKIKYLLVHTLRISHAEAQRLLDERQVTMAGRTVTWNAEVDEHAEVRCGEKILQEKTVLRYFLFNKPRGTECTLNPQLKDNLLPFIPAGSKLSPIGRLDKQSEGLMIFTNDGRLSQRILHGGIEKEYEVGVNKMIGEEFVRTMESGVKILGGRLTKPCKVKALSENSFRITLTQGLNRQIRRMCHKLGYEVVSLRRIRIDECLLGELKAGESVEVSKEMIWKQ